MLVSTIGIFITGYIGKEFMIGRKAIAYMVTAYLTSLLVAIILVIAGEEDNIMIYTNALTSFVVFFIVLVYGLPCSIIADLATKTFKGATKKLLSLTIHLVFGIGFATIVWLMFTIVFYDGNFGMLIFISILFASFIFWFVDELLKSKLRITKGTKTS